MKMIYALIALLPLSAFAHQHDSTDRTLVSLRSTDEVKAYLRSQHVDILGVNMKEGTVEAYLSAEELTKLQALKAQFQFQVPGTLLRGPDPEYMNPSEVEARLQEYAAKYPELAQLKQIGESLEKRPIWAIKISDNVAIRERSEPVAFFNGMHHAREVMTPEVTMDIVDYLLSNYNSDAAVRQWVDGNEIWVIPMFNVDGNNKVWGGESMWRKNVRDGHGVDINRNYPYAWNGCRGSSGFTWAQDYRGKSAASEPETQAMMKFASEIRPVVSISYHAYSELVIYPYGCKPRRAETADVLETVGKDIGKLLDYTPGTSWETLYSVDGGDIDWLYNELQTLPYVIEVSSTKEGFQPDYAEWRDKTVLRNRAGWQYLLNRLNGPGVRGHLSAKGNEALVVEVKDATGKLFQNYRVNPDGTYHVVLNPGTYTLSFLAGTRVLESKQVTVTDRRLDLNASF